MIVKVQAAYNRPGQVFVYDKNKTYSWQGDSPDVYNFVWKCVKKGAVDGPKVFFEAHVNKDGKIVLEKVCKSCDLDW